MTEVIVFKTHTFQELLSNLVYFVELQFFSMIKLKSDMTPFLQLLFKQCLTNTSESKLLEREKWSRLHQPRLCCCCLLCSSLTAACHN